MYAREDMKVGCMYEKKMILSRTVICRHRASKYIEYIIRKVRIRIVVFFFRNEIDGQSIIRNPKEDRYVRPVVPVAVAVVPGRDLSTVD